MVARFPFVSKRELTEHFQLSNYQQADLKRKLPSPIYWIQPVPGGNNLWNLCLIRSFLLNGLDSEAHKRLVEEFIATMNAKSA